MNDFYELNGILNIIITHLIFYIINLILSCILEKGDMLNKYIKNIVLVILIVSMILVSGCINLDSDESNNIRSSNEDDNNGPEVETIVDNDKIINAGGLLSYPISELNRGDQIEISFTNIRGGNEKLDFLLIKSDTNGGAITGEYLRKSPQGSGDTYYYEIQDRGWYNLRLKNNEGESKKYDAEIITTKYN